MVLMRNKKNIIKYSLLSRVLSSYLASAKCVCYHVLSAETAKHDKWLPAEPVCVILIPAETCGMKHSHADSLNRKPFFANSCLGRKQEIVDSLCGNQI